MQFEIGTQIGTITGFWINYGVQQTVGSAFPISLLMTDGEIS